MKSPVSGLFVQEIELPLLHCYRCGNSWTPRRPVIRICPKCKSPYFDTPRVRIPSYGGGLGVDDVIGEHRAEILRLARLYGAKEVRVFGSIARREGTLASDLDLLVTPSGRRFDPISLRLALQALLGRRVDVVSEQALHWYSQPQIVAEAVPL